MSTDDRHAAYLSDPEGHPSGQSKSLDDLRVTLAGKDTWANPPHDVEVSVVAGIRSGSVDGETGRTMAWRWLAVAATALILGVSLVVLWPTSTEVVMAGTGIQPEATGVALLDPTGAGWAIRLDVRLPPAEPGFYYEGWVWNDDGEGVSIGTFHLRDAKPVTLWSGVDLNEYPSIWVSLQKEGDGPTLSDQVVMRGRFESPEGSD